MMIVAGLDRLKLASAAESGPARASIIGERRISATLRRGIAWHLHLSEAQPGLLKFNLVA
jgi:hypothetical protein